MLNYSLPPLNSNLRLSADGRMAVWSQPWANWMSQTWQIAFDAQNSGTTAQRPTDNLYVGKPYFDTSLGTKGKPIWLGKDEATWVLADGTAA